MSARLLVGVAVVYGLVALGYHKEARHGMGLAFWAYALANVGFAWDAYKGGQ